MKKNITQYLRSGSLEYLESAIQRGLHYEDYIQIESNRRLTLHTKEEYLFLVNRVQRLDFDWLHLYKIEDLVRYNNTLKPPNERYQHYLSKNYSTIIKDSDVYPNPNRYPINQYDKLTHYLECLHKEYTWYKSDCIYGTETLFTSLVDIDLNNIREEQLLLLTSSVLRHVNTMSKIEWIEGNDAQRYLLNILESLRLKKQQLKNN